MLDALAAPGGAASVHLALAAAGSDRLVFLASLADEWQEIVDRGLGGEDVTVVTRVLGA
jgi:hypothetical protein